MAGALRSCNETAVGKGGRLSRLLPVKQVAAWFDLDWKTVKRIDKHALERELRRDLTDLAMTRGQAAPKQISMMTSKMLTACSLYLPGRGESVPGGVVAGKPTPVAPHVNSNGHEIA